MNLQEILFVFLYQLAEYYHSFLQSQKSHFSLLVSRLRLLHQTISGVKRTLDACISQLSEVCWLFSKKPGVYFSRNRKLPFEKIISTLLSIEGGSLTSELLKRFGCSADIASTSAFVQQRGKLNEVVFPMLFSLFVKKTDSYKQYKGLRILAADGSDIQVPTNPYCLDSYFPGVNGQAPYNLLHLDAMYDLLQHTYMDALLRGKRTENEQSSPCKMVDRSALKDVLLIADRGYEGYNLLAHTKLRLLIYMGLLVMP